MDNYKWCNSCIYWRDDIDSPKCQECWDTFVKIQQKPNFEEKGDDDNGQ